MTQPADIGMVIGGSLGRSIEIRLNPGQSAPLGHYVMLPLGAGTYLMGMVTDVALKAAESGPTSWPPPSGDGPGSALLREILLDTAVYTAVDVTPYLEVTPHDAAITSKARRLPPHFAPAFPADQEAMDAALGTSESSMDIGAPLGMDELAVRVDIERMFERSAGIFGKSGTGKTIFALSLLNRLVAHSRSQPTAAKGTVALIFDMHNDYGDETKFEGDVRALPGLRAIHGKSNVALYSVDENATGADNRVVIGTRDITDDDLHLLQTTANFTEAAIEASHQFSMRLGRDWIDLLTADEPSEAIISRLWTGERPDEPVAWPRVADRLGVHAGSLRNLQRGLRSITRRGFVQSGASQFQDTLDHIVDTLQGGRSVVIQFGRYGNDLASYMLVANMLSRRVWQGYQEATEAKGGDPNRLVIVIEEAHKFMDPSVSNRSIFGQIARELRKYNVTLLVIDQRPSQIDREVLSQIGTKYCFQLDNDQDVDALLGGVAGRAGLRQVLASLESQQQALAFGHALPMPIVVRPRDVTPGSLRARLGVAETETPGTASRRTSGGLYG